MSADLEGRLERAADDLPLPTDEARERARTAALAALEASEHPNPRRARGHLRLLLAAGTLAAATVAALLLAAPWEASPLTTERALAAIDKHPVVHAVLEATRPHSTIVDLSSGETTTELQQTEYWYDDERGLLRVRLIIGGNLLSEFVESRTELFTDLGTRQRDRPTPPRLDPALAGFATRYRDALESGEAQVVGEDVVDGRDAILLRITFLRGPAGEEVWENVAIAADDYRPLRISYSTAHGDIRWGWRVVRIETVPRDPRHFAPPEPAVPRPSQQTGVDERTLTPDEAATALDRPAVWPGRIVGGIELAQIELMRLTTRWTDGKVTEGRALVLQYGASRRAAHLEGRPSLLITEATSSAENLRYGSGAPTLPPGKLRLTGFGDNDSSEVDMWFGSMQRDGVYISLESSHRELILEAARSMVSLG
jgi:hypothetical protein